MPGPSFKVRDDERALIAQCVGRALKFIKVPRGFTREDVHRDICMDLAATHANGCPLDFQKLFDFPDFDFGHDIFGIRQHLDRKTGRLQHCFLPRCSKPRT